MLEVKNLKRTYKTKKGIEVKALDDVSLKIEETGMVFLLGKSGAGKSTLLNVLGGLDFVDSGEIIIKGKSSKDFTKSDFDSYRNTYVGFIFQEYNILNDFTVAQNIGLALELQGKKATSEIIDKILNDVDLVNLGKRKPNELSGGQKQRVAIARALVKNPEIIMADEPTGALDSNTGKQIFDTLKKLSKEKLVIIVSHDREFAELYADRIIEMKDGKIIEDVKKNHVKSYLDKQGIQVVENSYIKIDKNYELTLDDFELIKKELKGKNSDVIISLNESFNKKINNQINVDEDGYYEFIDSKNDEIILKTNEYNQIKSKLSLKKAFKMGTQALGHKKFRLFMTILLSFVAFGMFGFINTAQTYKKDIVLSESLGMANLNNVCISKYEKDYYESGSYYNKKYSNKNDYLELKDKLGKDIIPISRASTYLGNVNNMGEKSTDHFILQNISLTPYSNYLKNEYNINLLYGTTPNNNEVLITKAMLEVVERNGGSLLDVSYKPNSTIDPTEIIGKEISINNNQFKISGIVDTNYTKFDFDSSDYHEYENAYEAIRLNFHNSLFLNENIYYQAIKQEYVNNYEMYFENIYVSKIDKDLAIPYNEGMISSKVAMDYFINNGFTLPDDLLKYTEVFNWGMLSLYEILERTDTLMMSYMVKNNLDKLIALARDKGIDCNDPYNQELEYLKYNLTDDEKNALIYVYNYVWISEVNEDLIKQIDPNFTMDKMYNDLFKDILSLERNVIVRDYSSYENVKIPVTSIYYSGNYEVKINHEVCDGIELSKSKAVDCFVLNIRDYDLLKLANIHLEEGDTCYRIENTLVETFDMFDSTMEMLSQVFLIVGIILAVFSSLLLLNFISQSIAYKKREIGILRACGARSLDVFKIFFSESFIIAIINSILSIIALFILCNVLSDFLCNDLGFTLKVLNPGIIQIILIFSLSIVVSFIASFLPIYFIAKKKPIDSINNR